jgi:peptidoglycan/LPS O-acetylase OafA/YrhL
MAEIPGSGEREVVPLTSIRGIASIGVIGTHIAHRLGREGWGWFPPGPITRIALDGHLSVEMFFVLSGYILARIYPAPLSVPDFLVHRAARVLPLLWTLLVVIAGGIVALRLAGVSVADDEPLSLRSLPFEFTLTNIWFGVRSLDPPSWSLNVELVAYLLFPLLHFVGVRLKFPVLVGLAVLFFLAHVVLLHTIGIAVTGYPAIFRGIFAFGLGAMLAFAFKGARAPNWLPLVCVAAFAVTTEAGLREAALAALAVLIVALGAGASDNLVYRVMSTPPLAWLGRVSFSIYLLQIPVLRVVIYAMLHVPALHASPLAVAATMVGYVIVVLALAELTWRFVEVPWRRRVRRSWERFRHARMATTPAAA